MGPTPSRVVSLFVGIVALLLAGWFWFEKKKMVQAPVESDKNEQVTQKGEIPTTTGSEIKENRDTVLDIVSKSPNTTDWQVYRDNKLNIEFKMPKSWEVKV